MPVKIDVSPADMKCFFKDLAHKSNQARFF
jgi:hypothetical protein